MAKTSKTCAPGCPQQHGRQRGRVKALAPRGGDAARAAARELTQTKLADELQIGQGDVSKLERRTDMYVSTLASYLEAVGAHLEIRAVFPDGRTVKITQFSD